jgi:2-dehydro-3-deoxygluconokinase
LKRVVTFGEIMLRLAPEGYSRFVQAEKFCATYGGGEANVAVSLAGFGMNAAFVTKLPVHEIGQSAVNSLRRYGVDTSLIVRGGERIGVYYLEKGASQRPGKVIYDRAGSAMAQAGLDDFDWDSIFEGAEWFHFTGITPALGANVNEICLAAVKSAKAKEIRISCDLNYRKNLWTREKASEVMAKLLPYVDICFCNEADIADIFGIHANDTDITAGVINRKSYIQVAEKFSARFGVSQIAITQRESISANENKWAAMLYVNGESFFSKNYAVHIVDRVGGGDSFAAALIYAYMNNKEPQEAVEFAVAASCLKHSIEGDFNVITLNEVEKLVKGDGTGRVQR